MRPGGLQIRFWRPQSSILEGFWDVQVAPGWPQGLQIPCKMVSTTTVFGRSNLNAKNFDFGMRACAFPQKAWPRLGGGGVPPWGPSMELEPTWPKIAKKTLSWAPNSNFSASNIELWPLLASKFEFISISARFLMDFNGLGPQNLAFFLFQNLQRTI